MSVIKDVPTLPGVYIFKDKLGTVIYIGKAKSLKNRLQSYFQLPHTDWKLHALMEEQASFEYIVTGHESEALLLEAQLVRKYQPKYNTLLKNGNPLIYLRFETTLTLAPNNNGPGTFFGPFITKRDARGVYDYLIRTFRLYRCKHTIAQGCLDFHLERCAGTCRPDFDSRAYQTRLELAQQALTGDSTQFLATVQREIEHYNKEHEYEKARFLAAYIHNFETIFAAIATRYTEKKYARSVAHAVLPDYDYTATTAQELQQLVGLPCPPRTIDCFDISHFQSLSIVGSCVRFTDGKLDTSALRRFKIKSLVQQNDYAALQEIVRRRYRTDPLPDLILIDGGKGQLNAVKKILPEASLASLAKREERLYTTTNSEGIPLDVHTPAGKLLIALRDYAHHYAVNYHIFLRSKKNRET